MDKDVLGSQSEDLIHEHLARIEERLLTIEARNQRVERDKEWETSNARKLVILAITYGAMCILFRALSNSAPLLNAIVPTLGFFFSTLSLPLFKAVWLRKQKKPSDD